MDTIKFNKPSHGNRGWYVVAKFRDVSIGNQYLTTDGSIDYVGEGSTDRFYFPSEAAAQKAINNYSIPITNPCKEISMPPLTTAPKTRFKVFDKSGNVNAKGVIHQAAKHGFVDNRPFVNTIIDTEFGRILSLIESTNFHRIYEDHAPDLNIVLLAIINQLKAFQDAMDEKDYKASKQVKLSISLKYYYFEKLLADPTSHKWIADYLTKENMHADSVNIFVSNKFTIRISDGVLELFENVGDYDVECYRLPIKYDAENNNFHV